VAGTRTSSPTYPPRRSARARSSARPARSGPPPQGSTAAAAPTASRAWESTPGAPQAVGSCRPPAPRQACRAAGQPVQLDLGDGYLVDARRATVAAHLCPRPLQDISAGELVVQRVEPSSGIGLGRPVQRMLQGTDRVEGPGLLDAHRGGTSHHGHSPALLASLHADEAAALPITGGCVVRPARSVLRPPPTPC
jgi:hypothetical protein